MSSIFISYRRDDSKHIVGRIFDYLENKYGVGKIFKDVDSIPLGEDFRYIIENSVKSCDVVIVIIGTKWLKLTDDNGIRRIDHEDDFVRIEIEMGLKHNKNIIPVLVADASMPSEKELPISLTKIIYQNGMSIRADPDFKNDINRLIKSLDVILKKHNRFKISYVYYMILSLIVLSTILVSYRNNQSEIKKTDDFKENILDTKPQPSIELKRHQPEPIVITSRLARNLILDSISYKPGEILKLRVLANSSKIRSFAIFELKKGKIERVNATFSGKDGINIKYTIPDNTPAGDYTIEVFIQELGSSIEERLEVVFKVENSYK